MDSTHVAYLGPEGSFSDEAATRAFPKAEHISAQTIPGVFELVHQKKAGAGIVALENSTGGSIDATLDELIHGPFFIIKDFYLEITQCFMSHSQLKEIKKVYSHPQGFAQCRKWIAKNLKNVELIEVASTSLAAQMASKEAGSAAIASAFAAKKCSVPIIEKAINDDKDNSTRFIAISLTPAPPEGKKKTAIVFGIRNKPGALFDILSTFKDNKVNMTKIESRPSKEVRWEYLFFIEIDGSLEDANVKAAVQIIKDKAIEFKSVGSY